MTHRTVIVSLAALMMATALGSAAKVKVWHHASPAHYDKAKLKGAVVSSEGTLRLSRRLKPLVTLDATHVWDVLEDKQGNLVVATGDEGKIFRVSRDGKVSLAYDSEDSQVLCLVSAPDGTIYAGTGPGGRIISLAPDGAARVLCTTPESYIWSLALERAGENIYAGTGPKGKIYRITPQGKAEVFYATKQDHVLSLATSPDGTLYAGTDKNGLVYRFDGHGKGFVLYHAPQAEVRALLPSAGGVYIGTSSPRRRSSSFSSAGGDHDLPSNPGTMLVSTPKASKQKGGVPGRLPVSSSLTSGSKDREEKGSEESSVAPLHAGENSVYWIGEDGSTREIFRQKALILSLLRQQGRVFVGTGMEGQLFEVDEATKEHGEVARLDHGQIHCIVRRADGSIILGTGDPGKLYVLQDEYAATGTVTSDVLDAKLISKWGALRWKADAPAGTRLSVAVRSGNLAEPDETWSDWSAELTDPEQSSVPAPPARFLQYRITLSTDDAHITPALRSIALRYGTVNQAPEITAIEVPDLNASNSDNPKKLRFKWSASDPNDDEISYTLFVRKDGWKNWVQIEEGVEKKEYDWDTTATPSGVYQLKVVASDRKDNPAETALTSERISDPFTVAHEPPAVTLKVVGMEADQAVIEAAATDPFVRLISASFAVNGKKWVNVFPTDGLFDSKTETFRFRTESLKPGTYVVVLRVRNAAGNTGSGDAVFTVQTREPRP